MGRSVSIKCQKCGYNASLNLGAGMMFSNPNVIISMFDKELQEKISPLITGPQKAAFDASKELGICQKCKKAESVPVVRITPPGSSPITYRPTCSCGQDFVLYNTDGWDGEPNVPCPVCGNTLDIENIGLWD